MVFLFFANVQKFFNDNLIKYIFVILFEYQFFYFIKFGSLIRRFRFYTSLNYNGFKNQLVVKHSAIVPKEIDGPKKLPVQEKTKEIK